MTGSEYQSLAMRTNDGNCTSRLKKPLDLLSRENKPECFDSIVKDLGGVFNASLGLSGEVGEFNDMIKKWIFHEKKIDIDHAKKELGDIMWYVAMMAESFGWNLDEIMQMNVDKLIARFPDGFDVDRANNRSDDDV